jgi:hypothetical protein
VALAAHLEERTASSFAGLVIVSSVPSPKWSRSVARIVVRADVLVRGSVARLARDAELATRASTCSDTSSTRCSP